MPWCGLASSPSRFGLPLRSGRSMAISGLPVPSSGWQCFAGYFAACSKLFAKSFSRDTFDHVARQYLDALSELEHVIPCCRAEMLNSSIGFLPSPFIRWFISRNWFGAGAPLNAIVWAFALERWIRDMKAHLHSTREQTSSIASNLQVSSAATFARADSSDQYAVDTGVPLLSSKRESLEFGDEIIFCSLSGPSSSLELDRLERCWLHHHLYNLDGRSWSCIANHSWRGEYIRLVQRFETVFRCRVGTFAALVPKLDLFDSYCRRPEVVQEFGFVRLPVTMKCQPRLLIGNCLFRDERCDNSYKTNNDKFVADFGDDGLFMGTAAHFCEFNLDWTGRSADESQCLVLIHVPSSPKSATNLLLFVLYELSHRSRC